MGRAPSLSRRVGAHSPRLSLQQLKGKKRPADGASAERKAARAEAAKAKAAERAAAKAAKAAERAADKEANKAKRAADKASKAAGGKCGTRFESRHAAVAMRRAVREHAATALAQHAGARDDAR